MCVDSCGRRFGRAFSVKSSVFQRNRRLLVSRIVLQVNATCEFETRTLNPERAALLLPDFFAFIVRLIFSNIKSGCYAITALISKIVVSSIA